MSTNASSGGASSSRRLAHGPPEEARRRAAGPPWLGGPAGSGYAASVTGYPFSCVHVCCHFV